MSDVFDSTPDTGQTAQCLQNAVLHKVCTALVRMNLVNNDIYEEGTRTLETVPDDGQNAGMHVNLRTNNITDEDIQRISQKHLHVEM